MKQHHAIGVAVFGVLGALAIPEIATAQPTLTTLAPFTSATGFNPAGQLYVDGSGNVLGTARSGGANNDGVIFEYNGSSGLTTRYSFANGADSEQPISGLVADTSGNLYGATNGPGNGTLTTVFRIGPSYTAASFTTLATVSNTAVSGSGTAFGQYAPAGLTLDAAGNIYGTTTNGGGNSYGTAFTVPKSAATTTGYAATATNLGNGLSPYRATSGLTLVGATLYGVAAPTGNTGGSLYSVSTASTGGNVNQILTFGTANEGPTGKLVADANGNLFGESFGVGTTNTGTIFEITAAALANAANATPAVTTLATFTTGTTGTGYNPTGGLIVDAAGNLFGVTAAGGASGFGTVFELPTAATTSGYAAAATVLGSLGSTETNGANLAYNNTLAVDGAGNLYGETYGATNSTTNQGTLFEVTGSGYVVASPEPTSLALVGFATGAGILGRRRR